MKICWLTDLHLNILSLEERLAFYVKLCQLQFDSLLITGDIAEGPSLIPILHEISQQIKSPVYFVLGNHDYMGKEIAGVRQAIDTFCVQNPRFYWLRGSRGQRLTDKVLLLGVDSWVDLRLGHYVAGEEARFYYHDIPDFQVPIEQSSQDFLSKVQALAKQDVNILAKQLNIAMSADINKVLILLHIPPFADACWRHGQRCDALTLPFFTCKVMGELLLETAIRQQQVDFVVLCGHTHNHCVYRALNNLKIIVGEAKTGTPQVQRYFNLEQLFGSTD